MDVMKDCQAYFNLTLPSELLSRCYEKFLLKMFFSKDIFFFLSIVALLFEL